MLSRNVFHGKRGELRQSYRHGQEDQLGALGLIVNVIVLWNTIYMDAALRTPLNNKTSETQKVGRRHTHGTGCSG